MAVFGASTRKMTSSEALQRHFSKYLHPISRQSEELNLHLHTLALGTTTLTATSHSWQHANALSWITPGIYTDWVAIRCLSVCCWFARLFRFRKPEDLLFVLLVCHYHRSWFVLLLNVFSFAKVVRFVTMPSTAGYFTQNYSSSLPQITV